MARRVKIIKPKRSMFTLSSGPGALQKADPSPVPVFPAIWLTTKIQVRLLSHLIQVTLPKEGEKRSPGVWEVKNQDD